MNDHLERKQATDPRGSYIVQAPAGSGKTEILTQRFLRLLATVEAPEQIIALTFTRKAANEMRERILLALQRAAKEVTPTSEHQQLTQTYAKQALLRDAHLRWNILTQPSRLRILTIDALCQMLAHSIPIPGNYLHYATLCDKPELFYQNAARRCFHYAAETADYQPALKILLTHLDNRQDTILALFCALLANREQWMPLLYQAKTQDKALFEAGIAWIEQHELSRFQKSLPFALASELVSFVQFFANLVDIHHELRNWSTFADITPIVASHLSALLLTTDKKWRKAFDHHVGLRRGACPDETYTFVKENSKRLLHACADYPDFKRCLLRVSRLPEPHYSESQWNVLQALFQLLPLLVAHLTVCFTEENALDFTSIAELARQGLGDDTTPTDLALYLDHRIQHLLVDEFQDTSIQQFQLLTQLVQGWEPHDGRTLFIVGDPMQSIYRFRSAEVGLFLRAQQEGIGPVRLEPLAFCCNFRSTELLVQWVNERFRGIFPSRADIESGAVPFHASVSTKPCLENTFIKALHTSNRIEEATLLVDIIKEELHHNPDDSMAILVRSRRQLLDIIRTLRAERIPFQGVDIDLLAELPHIRDVCALTEALLKPASRLPWLCVLRSPLCGLSLPDLHAIASFEVKASIYHALRHLDDILALSAEGRLRAKAVFHILHDALQKRHQQSLVNWIIETLDALYAKDIFTANQLHDLEQFWMLLAQFEKEGPFTDVTNFKEALKSLYSQRGEKARLQIMTIHKSKGLEFDCVFLPSLSAPLPQKDTPLFRWLKLPSSSKEILLLSPIKAAEDDVCLLYDYLESVDSEKAQYENQRLLYVAATRAKSRLYLSDHGATVRQGTFRALLEHQTFTKMGEEHRPDEAHERIILPKRAYLPQSFYQKPLQKLTLAKGVSPLPSELSNRLPRLIGIVTHELLCWICTHHPKALHDVPWLLASRQLQQLGFSGEDFHLAMATIKQQIQSLYQDPIGQWIIQAHQEEKNEYALLVGPPIATRIIDRTFVFEEKRWIIDFKTGQESPKSTEEYRKQVDAYANLFTLQTDVPIHCGLYYLSSNHWVTWKFVAKTGAVK